MIADPDGRVAAGDAASDDVVGDLGADLPDGVAVADLPVVPSCCEGPRVEIDTDCELEVLSRLTTWALDENVSLAGLSVMRQTLEDVYLRLTHEALNSVDEVLS